MNLKVIQRADWMVLYWVRLMASNWAKLRDSLMVLLFVCYLVDETEIAMDLLMEYLLDYCLVIHLVHMFL